MPLFLFLGGTAGSGKSTLLRILNGLVGLEKKRPDFPDFDNIATGHHYKAETVDNLYTLMVVEENVAPLFIDEIKPWFFAETNRGNDLIKTVSNWSRTRSNPTPVLIGTTNTEEFTLEAAASRRSYYLQIDRVFDDRLRKESVEYYNNIKGQITNSLYLDFVLRMGEVLETVEDQAFRHYGKKSSKVDFLYQTRKIFEGYYEMAELPLPIYFPQGRYDDSRESAQQKWRKLYLGTSNKDFIYNGEEDVFIFKITTLDEHQRPYSKISPSQEYKNALDQRVVRGSLSGQDIELDATAFLEWIGVKEKKERFSFLKNLFRRKIENP